MNDPQPPPPLAEGRWLWRRLYVFAASFGLLGLLAIIIRATPPASLPRVADGLMSLLALLLVVYLVAPTAEQLVEMLASLKRRSGPGGRP